MDTQASQPPAPHNQETESLEQTSVKASASAVVTTEEKSTSENVEPQMSTIQRPKEGLLQRFNIYLVLLFVIVLLVVGGIAAAVAHNHTPTKGNTVNSQNLTAAELAQLAASNATVGSPQQELTIQSDTTFNGTVLVKKSLSVAGSINVGSSLNISNITVSGSSNLGTAQTTNLTVSGSATIQKDITVNGAGNFSGAISTPQLTTPSLNITGDFSLSHHLLVNGPAPARSEGGALGNGGTASVTGSDSAGEVTLNTGSSPSSGCFVSLNFSAKFSATPYVIIAPASSAAAGVQYYVSPSATGFSICTNTAAGTGQSLVYTYFVIG